MIKRLLVFAIIALVMGHIFANDRTKDSVLISISKAKISKTYHDVVCLLAHCEGVKCKAYWDPNGKVWTIGIGNTVKPIVRHGRIESSPIKSGDCITDENTLIRYVTYYIEQHLLADMITYLPIDSMEDFEITSMTCLLYNCSTGILKNKDKSPSEFAKVATAYFEDRCEKNRQALQTLIEKYVYAKRHKVVTLEKRRDLEARVLFGDIVMDNEGILNLENSVNFSEVAIGGIYSMGKLPADSVELCNNLREINGRNLNDSISYQLTIAQAHPIKRTVKHKKMH